MVQGEGEEIMNYIHKVPSTCSKCYNGKLGPARYCNSKYCLNGREHLHETCSSCGYHSTKPCADDKTLGNPQIVWMSGRPQDQIRSPMLMIM